LMREDAEKRCPWCGKRVTTPEESAARRAKVGMPKYRFAGSGEDTGENTNEKEND